MVELFFQRRRGALLGKRTGEIAQQRRPARRSSASAGVSCTAPRRGRKARPPGRARPAAVRPRPARAASAGSRSTMGRQQRLPRDAGLGALLLQPLIDEPLVGGVLVDQHQPVAGLGDDVGFVNLRPRRAERGVERVLVGGADAAARRRRARPRRRRRASAHRVAAWRGDGASRVPVFAAGAASRLCANCCQRARRKRGRGAVQRRGERLLQRADDEAAHQAGIGEAHLRLGRVDVDVHLLGGQSRNRASVGCRSAPRKSM